MGILPKTQYHDDDDDADADDDTDNNTNDDNSLPASNSEP